MRVCLIGNIAQNAYLLAKGLRDRGVDAVSYDAGGGYSLQVPYWEEGDFDPHAVQGQFWAWSRLPMDNHYHRPEWARILGNDGAEPEYATQEAYEADLARVLRGQIILPPAETQRRDLLAHRTRLSVDELASVAEAAERLPDWRSVLRVAQSYDLVVLCGAFAAMGALLPPAQPYIAFEHGTMRYAGSLATPDHRLLALGYQHADACVITNADCWEAAGQLGVRAKATFIPHPLDADTFAPAACPREDRARLLAALQCDLVALAPARHSRSEASGSKRNDRILHAYARYVQEQEPLGAPRLGLVLASWGTPAEVRESEGLVRALGLRGRVAWIPCLPKRRLLSWYRAADIVLDQFSDTVGSFGAVTVEAMAVGKPVITYYAPSVHRWCDAILPEAPPLWMARTTDEIADGLRVLCQGPERRRALGRQARTWIERWHTLPRVAALHETLYQDVLGRAWQRVHAQRAQPQTPASETAAAPAGAAERVVWTDVGPVGIGRNGSSDGTKAPPVAYDVSGRPYCVACAETGSGPCLYHYRGAPAPVQSNGATSTTIEGVPV